MIQQISTSIRKWFGSAIAGWDRFWFTPQLPHTLALIRIATGAMLLYTHLVLASDLESFLGKEAWIESELARQLHDGTFGPNDGGWSYLWSIESPTALWIHQLLAIVASGCLMLGLLTRVVAPLTWLLQLMFVHRLTGALFGLDQVTTMLAFYVMLSPCGSVYSLDSILRKRFVKTRDFGSRFWRYMFPDGLPTTSARIATRLAQLHVCVIYMFGGLWKARGEQWWDGTAMWFAAVNYEYQSNDLTWIARYPALFAGLAHLTVFWETFYCALVWPKWTRPLVLITAVMVHGGIALYLGMITFGTIMIVANGMFLEPEWTRSILKSIRKRNQ